MRTSTSARNRFRHEAWFYEGPRGFLDAVLPFIRGGIEAGEPVLVAVDPPKIDRLREELNGDAGGVQFADMRALGHNPARIIPAWQAFAAEHLREDRPVRGVGEPIWPGRAGAELEECHLHEALLNVAFDDGPPWWLVCPYDTTALEPAVVAEARETHPVVVGDAGPLDSEGYPGLEGMAARFKEPLPEPSGPHDILAFDTDSLLAVRRFVIDRGKAEGLGPQRVADLVLAINEIATNSLRHAGGGGTLRIWAEKGALICEVTDRGRIDDPMVGRNVPLPTQEGGRGIWLANLLVDLVQVRSSDAGSTIRLHVGLTDGLVA